MRPNRKGLYQMSYDACIETMEEHCQFLARMIGTYGNSFKDLEEYRRFNFDRFFEDWKKYKEMKKKLKKL